LPDIAEGDVVKLTMDHVPLTRGQWFVVEHPYTSLQFGECVWMRLIEHFPGSDWPEGMRSFWRCVPVAWLKKDESKTRAWNERSG